jgi:hypothetical protein
MPTLDLARLGASLRRVTLADRPLPEGGKKVWHQGDEGVEVLSFVDAEGRVLRQECYLGHEAVVWQTDRPLNTAAVQGSARGAGIARSELLVNDERPRASVMRAALELLRAAPANDLYLKHLRDIVDSSVQGLDDSDDPDDKVTSMQIKSAPPMPKTKDRLSSRAYLLVFVSIGAALLLGAFYVYYVTFVVLRQPHP